MFYFTRNHGLRHDNVYGAVIMTEPLREFTQFIWQIQKTAGQLLTSGPSQSPWATGPPEQAATVSTFTTAIYYHQSCRINALINTLKN